MLFPEGLVPPSLSSGTEVSLSPGAEHNLSIITSITVRKSKGKRGRSTDDMTIRGVLRPVARAHELVVGSGPRDNATQMSAHGVKTVRFKCLVVLDNQVSVRKRGEI